MYFLKSAASFAKQQEYTGGAGKESIVLCAFRGKKVICTKIDDLQVVIVVKYENMRVLA